ncbi:MAG: hypothetical protein E7463_15135 [Ruminococcaceae bacterium]|nr:hypothetical protein [Oscillospiraceae bacterium]
MRYREAIDPFFDNQPPLSFVEDLKKPMHICRPARWNVRPAAGSEVFVPSIRLEKDFPDPDGLLDTMYDDFSLFLKVYGHDGGTYPIRTVCGASDCHEAWSVNVTLEECVVSAGDTEGIRRALVWIEDEMHRREGSFLPLGETARKPHVKTRITRCFFSPTNRPPKNGEELGDDVDYYPDGYLNRLAHDGVNGVWIYTHFRDLVPSEIIPEYSQDWRRRMDKLNRTIAQCARYGIRVYLLGVEPSSTYKNELLRKTHPELLGQRLYGEIDAFCISTEKGIAYAEECTRTLFTLAPGLAGYINISCGESLTHCASQGGVEITCPNCAGKSEAQILAECEAALARGMHAVKPEAEFISWPYAQRGWKFESVRESCRRRSDDVILMQNFEDWGLTEQLGKERIAIDYWLSYVGPGRVFEVSEAVTRKRDLPMYAKLQVCSSHEVSTVPYVPVPGILYKKYRYMYEHGISGAMQCWYFGNYPSLMSKAAAELSFEPFFDNADDFLRHLAGIWWGSDADRVVEAWKCFEEGYSNFPVNVAFEWFGPMQDGPAWPLHLEPIDMPLSGTWQTIDMVGGDRMGECMQGHTHEEAMELSRRMCEGWKKGMAIMQTLDDRGEEMRFEQKSVASALDLQFASGMRIIRFYQLRDMLGLGHGDAGAILDEMEAIVRTELNTSRELSALCENDNRLGYHSEAEGFKYFPEKLDWRVKKLGELLETEFPRTRARIAAGEPALPFYYGLEEASKRYEITAETIEEAPWDSFYCHNGEKIEGFGDSKNCIVAYERPEDPDTQARMAEDEDSYILQLRLRGEGEFLIRPEWTIFHPSAAIPVGENGAYFASEQTAHNLHGERQQAELAKWACDIREYDGWREYTFRLRKSDFPLIPGDPFRLDIQRRGAHTSGWGKHERMYRRLVAGTFSPDAYVFVIPKKR